MANAGRVWNRVVAAGASAGVLLALATGCSDGDDEVTDTAPASTSTPTSSPTPATAAATPTPTPSEETTSTPTPEPSETPTAVRPPTVPPSRSPTPGGSASASPTASPATTGAQRGLRSARADARRIAPQLKTYFDEREYPADRQQLLTTLGDAGVTLGAGNSIGGYGLADSGVDLTLCVQHDGGGWAAYDTAAGKVEESGATGACPAG